MNYESMTNEELMNGYDTDRNDKVNDYIETALDTVSGFAQGATFNLGDEFYAGTQALGKYIGSGGTSDFAVDYQKAHDMEQIRMSMVNERSPVASTAGELAAMAPFLGKLAATKAPALMQPLQYAGIGGITGFGSGDGMTGSLQQAAIGAGSMMAGGLIPINLAAMTGGVSNRTLKVLGFIADKAIPKSVVSKAAKQAALTTLKDNPVKAGLGLAATATMAGMPMTAASGLVGAGVAGTKQLVQKFPKTAAAIGGLGTFNALEDMSNPYEMMTDEELLEGYGEPDYSKMSDEELLEGYE